MRLRVIIGILALLTLLAVAAGGAFHYYSLKKSLEHGVHRVADEHVSTTALEVSAHLSEQAGIIGGFSRYPPLQKFLQSGGKSGAEDIDSFMDVCSRSFEEGICYLMGPDGTTLAASNRGGTGSFVGKNYAFRPYFTEAIQGRPSMYLALGVTSGKRGVYFSQPVRKEAGGEILGVITMKMAVNFLDTFVREKPGRDVRLLVSPDGIIFVSSRPDWLFRSLEALPPATAARLKQERQFGEGPWKPVDLIPAAKGRFEDTAGNEFVRHLHELPDFPGWRVVWFHDNRAVISGVLEQSTRTVGEIVILLAVIFGIGVSFLHAGATREIMLRKVAEAERETVIANLREALQEIRTLRGIIPICAYCKKMRDDQGYWNQIETYLRDHSDARLTHGICPECMQKEMQKIEEGKSKS